MEPSSSSAAPAAALSRYECLVKVFEFALNDALKPLLREKFLRNFFGEEAAKTVIPLFARMANSIRTSARKDFMSLCEQYNVQQELKRLEETCNLPYTDPAQLTIDIEKYIQSQTERIQSSTEKERLAAENERLDRAVEQARQRLDDLRSERALLLAQINERCTQLQPLVAQFRQVSADFQETDLSKWINDMAQ